MIKNIFDVFLNTVYIIIPLTNSTCIIKTVKF